MSDTINDIVREIAKVCVSMVVIDVGLMIAIVTLWIKVNTIQDNIHNLTDVVCSSNINSEYCQTNNKGTD